MKFNSFRSRVLLTLIIVVSLFSSLAFYLYSRYLSENINENTEKNTASIMNMVNLPCQLSNKEHTFKDYEILFDDMLKNQYVTAVYFVDSLKRLRYRETKEADKIDSATIINPPGTEAQNVIFKAVENNNGITSRAFLKLLNRPTCKKCHKSEQAYLGHVAIDFSINQTKENLNFTRRFSISFTVSMVIIIAVFIMLMHYKFVRGAIKKFKDSMNKINKGDLGVRVAVSKSKELGSLAKDFNIMMDNFEDTTNKLNKYHEKELNNVKKMATVGEMAARLAHEIRNPMTGISNAVEIITEETEDEENIQILYEIKKQANRVNNAVSKLLKYSKNIKINKEKGKFNELIESIIFFLKNQAGNKSIKFIFENRGELPQFFFDIEQMETVMLNLSLNSMQAISESGYIEYTTKYDKENKEILISVEDNGEGIEEEKLEDIFKPFYTTKTEGTGLGMAIINETVSKHDGRISVKSTYGEGTKFFIVLPALEYNDTKNEDTKS